MQHRFQSLTKLSRKIQSFFKSQLLNNLPTTHHQIPHFLPPKNHYFLHPIRTYHPHIDNDALTLQTILKSHPNKPNNELENALYQCGVLITEDLVLNVLQRHRSDWKPAYAFFNWVSRASIRSGYLPNVVVHNEILDILGRMKRFDEMTQVFDEMSKRMGFINERTYGIVVNRYSAAHKTEEAIEVFYMRKEWGLEMDLIAFQTLLLSLCRYKHVEAAEVLFYNEKNEFREDIKTWNIILNGWCVLGSLREAKRFWNDIVESKCTPDRFTSGIFINALSKAGKISTAVKLFCAMWEKGCTPDVAICNTVIDGLCFKKRVPEALEIFHEMNEKDCPPNTATYNSLVKHLCKIRRMEKVYELLDEMEMKGGSCLPNAITYGYLLSSSKKQGEVIGIWGRMERIGCKMTSDTYNLLLRLFMKWYDQERVKSTWVEMERSGMGPDRRSYTIMIHGLYNNGTMEDALRYFNEMTLKGMIPEPRTELLVNNMKTKVMHRESESGCMEVMTRDNSSKLSYNKGKLNRKAK